MLLGKWAHKSKVGANGNQNPLNLPPLWSHRLKDNCFFNIAFYNTAGLHKLWYPGIRDMSTWSKFGAHGEYGDVFLFSNLGAL